MNLYLLSHNGSSLNDCLHETIQRPGNERS